MALHIVTLKMAYGLSIQSMAKHLLKCFKFMMTMALNHLGMLKSRSDEDENNYSLDNPTSYVLVTDGPCPSIITVSADVLTSMIKKKLPVVEYGNFLQRFGVLEDTDHGPSECSVCLDCIEKSQEIRELSNCCHVFHTECLDRWVDESQITCPLCRSMLLPLKGDGIILG